MIGTRYDYVSGSKNYARTGGNAINGGYDYGYGNSIFTRQTVMGDYDYDETGNNAYGKQLLLKSIHIHLATGSQMT